MTMSSFFIIFWCCDVNVRCGHGVISEFLFSGLTSFIHKYFAGLMKYDHFVGEFLASTTVVLSSYFYFVFMLLSYHICELTISLSLWTMLDSLLLNITSWEIPECLLVLGQTWVVLITRYWNCKQEATLCLIIYICGTSAFSTLTISILSSFFHSTPATICSGSEFCEYF